MVKVTRDDQYLPDSRYAYSLEVQEGGRRLYATEAELIALRDELSSMFPPATVTMPQRGDHVTVKVGIETDPETGTYKPVVMSIDEIAHNQAAEIRNRLKLANGGTIEYKPYLVGEYTEPFPANVFKSVEEYENSLKSFAALHNAAKHRGLI